MADEEEGPQDVPAPVVDRKEIRDWNFYRAVIAEFMATLLFLYFSLTALVGVARTNVGGIGILVTAWAFGIMIFVLVYCIAGISGGHINPAVTFGLFLAKKVTIVRAVAYMVAQCLGALCGAAIARGIQGSEAFEAYGQGAVNGVQPGHNIGQALGAEIMGTYLLLYTVLSATDPQRNARDSHVPVLAPLPIGFAVFVIHLATIPITGTGINPARSLGAAVANPQHGKWAQHWIFWVGPIIGATLAGGHINPAVTFGLFLAKKVTIVRAVAYMVAQCLGALCGAAIARGIQGSEAFEAYGQGAVNGVQPGHNIGQALGAEIMGTYLLLYTVLSATDPQRNARDSHVPVLAPLPIGFAVFWIFWIGPIIGATCAAMYHTYVLKAGRFRFRNLYE